MARPFNHGVSSWMRWGVAIAAAVALLAAAPSTNAKPKTIHAAAYEHMKAFMKGYDEFGFAKEVDFGAPVAYRKKLASLTFAVDSKLKRALAKYDPTTKKITFAMDPRKVPAALSERFGETTWHEVTHAFEDQHGDTGLLDSEFYRERNVDYMAHVIGLALPMLKQMEREAKAGASVEKLRDYWEEYLKRMADASKLPSTTAYPPDLKLMKDWFGFKADPAAIKDWYLTGKPFAGKKWANLRRALTPSAPATWTGEWRQTTNGPPPQTSLPISFLQSGSSVTGTKYWVEYGPTDREGYPVQGVLSADGMTMTGSWIDPRGAYPNGGAHETFVITVAADWRSWEGTCTWGNGKGSQGWWGWR